MPSANAPEQSAIVRYLYGLGPGALLTASGIAATALRASPDPVTTAAMAAAGSALINIGTGRLRAPASRRNQFLDRAFVASLRAALAGCQKKLEAQGHEFRTPACRGWFEKWERRLQAVEAR